MKLVFIGPFGLRPKGTMSVRALPLARALVAHGHQVTMLIPPWDDPNRAGQSWHDCGVQVVNVPLPAAGVSRLPLLFHILLTRTLAQRALALQPDAIHLFKPKAHAGLAHLFLWARQKMGPPSPRLVVDTDDWEQAWNRVLPYSAGQKWFFAWQERWGLTHAHAITAASRALMQLAAEAGVGSDQLFYLPNGWAKTPENGAETPPQPNPSTILLYTRFAEFRLERVVSLVQQVAASVPDAHWRVVGKGFLGEEKTLQTRLREAGLAGLVDFTGWLPANQLPACFAAAAVAVHPYDDTLLNRTKCSVKLIDLLAAGVPVVADAVGQNTEYIRSGVSGILTPPEDDRAMAGAVVRLLQSPQLRAQMGQAAASFIRNNYNWQSLAQIAIKAYIF
jgi:glycosyltransferase involved in cell wall biosynthesis